MFEMEKALANANSIMRERQSRKVSKQITYVLYFSNNEKQPEGSMRGYTIKQLQNEFYTAKGTYKYAFITKIGQDKVLRFYSSAVGKKFFSLSRTGKGKTKV